MDRHLKKVTVFFCVPLLHQMARYPMDQGHLNIIHQQGSDKCSHGQNHDALEGYHTPSRPAILFQGLVLGRLRLYQCCLMEYVDKKIVENFPQF